MADFDPDAFLATKPKPAGFDPDAFLKGEDQPRRALDIMGGDSKMERDRALLKSRGGRSELASRKGGDGMGLLADIAMEGGGATAGQMIGALPLLSVPTFGASVPIGGALGGMAGNIAAQNRRISAGEQEAFKWGQLAGMALAGAVPGAPVAGTGVKILAKEAGKQALAGVAAKTVETGIDEGRLPTKGEVAVTSMVPAAGGVLAQRLRTKPDDFLNPAERATLEAAKKEGLKVIPSHATDSFLNKRLESIGGKAAVKQAVQAENVESVTAAAKKAIGIPERAQLNEGALEAIRKAESAPYAEIEAMSKKARARLDEIKESLPTGGRGAALPDEQAIAIADAATKAEMQPLVIQANADINRLREARNTARKEYAHYERQADPKALDRAREAESLADTLENQIEDAAQQFGTPDLLDRLRASRTRIAKTWDVENALVAGNNEVSAGLLLRALKKGRPLSGDLETIANFKSAFGESLGEPGRIPTAGVSALEPLVSAGALMAGKPLAAGLPLLRGPARSLLLSKPYQALATAEPFALPNTATAARVGSRVLAQEVAPDNKTSQKVAPITEKYLLGLSAPARAKAIDDTLKKLGGDDQIKFWNKLSATPDMLTKEVRDEVTSLQGGAQAMRAKSAVEGEKDLDANIPTLTPAEAKAAPTGTKFRGSNGNTYEKLPDGKIRKL